MVKACNQNSVPAGYKQTEMGLIPHDWKIEFVGNVVEMAVGGDLKEKHFSNIGDEKFRFPVFSNTVSRKGLYGYSDLPDYQGDCLTVVGRGVGLGTAFRRKGKFSAIGRLLVLFPCVTVDAGYMVEYINNRVEIFFESGGVPQLTGLSFAKYMISLPPTKAEQQAIATALSDVDELIGSLEKLIAKKRAIKTGAMQQLLTGKKRLPGFEGEWESKRLGACCEHITTGKLDANAMKPDGEYRFYTCAKDYYYIDKYAFDTEALLVSGNGANVGYIHYYHGKFNAYQRTYVLSGFSESIKFIQHFMGEELSDRIRVEVNAGNTPYITMGTLTEMRIDMPPTITEQQAIAKVLSDMDSEIQALDKRLQKTKAIKQGMMQELLTGKTRLV